MKIANCKLQIDKIDKNKQRGFTLIELLLVVSLIAILAGLGMTTFSKANQRQKLSAQADKVVDYLHKVQSFATSGATDSSGNSVDAFYFQAESGAKNFAVGYHKAPTDTSIETKTLQEPVVFGSVTFPYREIGTNNYRVYFSLPLGQPADRNLTRLTGNQTVNVCSPAIGYYTVAIEPAGRIYKGDFHSGTCPS